MKRAIVLLIVLMVSGAAGADQIIIEAEQVL